VGGADYVAFVVLTFFFFHEEDVVLASSEPPSLHFFVQKSGVEEDIISSPRKFSAPQSDGSAFLKQACARKALHPPLEEASPTAEVQEEEPWMAEPDTEEVDWRAGVEKRNCSEASWNCFPFFIQ
jgi:hypothetical protein